MDFIKMIMELPGEKRSQDVVEHTEWNNLWKLIVTQGNHSENYLEQLYDYLFNKEGWVHKVQAELDGVQPYLEGVMTQPVGKAPDGSLWTYPSTESGTVPWGNVMGDITKQQDLIQKFTTKADVEHRHDINTLTFNEGDIDGSWIANDSIGETAYGPKSVPTSALKDLSVTSEKLNNGAVTTAKIASSAVINDNIANGSVSGAKIADGAVSVGKIADGSVTRAKLASDALHSPGKDVKGLASSSTYALNSSDAGLTLWYSGGPTDFLFTISRENSASMIQHSEIAIFRIDSGRIKLQFGSNMLVGIQGIPDWLQAPTLEIAERFGMIALKYIANLGDIDLWLVTGNVEVV